MKGNNDGVCSEIYENVRKELSKFSSKDEVPNESIIIELLEKLYLKSIEEEFFWEFCTYRIWEQNVQTNKAEFLMKYEASEIDFWQELLEDQKVKVELCWPGTYEYDYSGQYPFIPTPIYIKRFLDRETCKRIEFSEKKKGDYVLGRIAQLKLESGKELESVDKIIDLSDMIKTDKYVILDELGILRGLKEKYEGITINQIASIISAISGIKVTSVQPSINSIITENTSAKSYPTKTSKQRAIQTLINLNIPNYRGDKND